MPTSAWPGAATRAGSFRPIERLVDRITCGGLGPPDMHLPLHFVSRLLITGSGGGRTGERKRGHGLVSEPPPCRLAEVANSIERDRSLVVRAAEHVGPGHSGDVVGHLLLGE